MTYGQKGESKFIPAGTGSVGTSGCADGWDDRFPIIGPNRSISTVAVDSTGIMYFGGAFTAVGNVTPNYIRQNLCEVLRGEL